jgi:hypothetical protein
MTRINCVEPKYLLDEWVGSHVREGLRPLNNILKGKDSIDKSPDDWKLGQGHEYFCRKHLVFTMRQWYAAKAEWVIRGGQGFDFTPAPFLSLDEKYLNDYTPTTKAIRSNIARLCSRWRNREKTLHFKGKPIDNVKQFRQYLAYLKLMTGAYKPTRNC